MSSYTCQRICATPVSRTMSASTWLLYIYFLFYFKDFKKKNYSHTQTGRYGGGRTTPNGQNLFFLPTFALGHWATRVVRLPPYWLVWGWPNYLCIPWGWSPWAKVKKKKKGFGPREWPNQP
jgi:hypothetical protein